MSNQLMMCLRERYKDTAQKEYMFDEPATLENTHKIRKWRFDIAYAEKKIAIEIEGGVWKQGRHTRGEGFIKDMEKYNRATALGWRILRISYSGAEQLGEEYKKFINNLDILLRINEEKQKYTREETMELLGINRVNAYYVGLRKIGAVHNNKRCLSREDFLKLKEYFEIIRLTKQGRPMKPLENKETDIASSSDG